MNVEGGNKLSFGNLPLPALQGGSTHSKRELIPGSSLSEFVGKLRPAPPVSVEVRLEKKEVRKERLEKGFSIWDGSHRGLTKIIKDLMNDLGSYEHVETVYWDMGNHLVVPTTFRDKNVFSGFVRNWVKTKANLGGNVLEAIEQDQGTAAGNTR